MGLISQSLNDVISVARDIRGGSSYRVPHSPTVDSLKTTLAVGVWGIKDNTVCIIFKLTFSNVNDGIMDGGKTFVSEIHIDEGTEEDLAVQIYESLTTLGFACLKSDELWQAVDRYARKARQFFVQDDSIKEKYRLPEGGFYGWVSSNRESVNLERPGDYRESFNIVISKFEEESFPPELHKSEAAKVMEIYSKLAKRILRLIGLSLNLQNPDTLTEVHNFDNKNNPTAMRINYYPPISVPPKENQVRCGEHSDYGTITILYTDSPGLEVLDKTTGEYNLCGQSSGGIYVNIGDLLQFWSDDVLHANMHRVMIPTEQEFLKSDRISIAFFCHPDDETVVESLDGSQKFSPVRAGAWLRQKFTAIFKQDNKPDSAQD